MHAGMLLGWTGRDGVVCAHLEMWGVDLTVDTMTTSASSPWQVSTDSTCRSQVVEGRALARFPALLRWMLSDCTASLPPGLITHAHGCRAQRGEHQALLTLLARAALLAAEHALSRACTLQSMHFAVQPLRMHNSAYLTPGPPHPHTWQSPAATGERLTRSAIRSRCLLYMLTR